MSILSAKDGGYYISATRFDYETQLNEYDLFVIKLNNEGLITGTQKQNIKIKRLEIYPNPACNYVNVNSIDNGIVEIFDLSGQLVYCNNIQKGNNNIDIQSLSKGCYLIRLLIGNKITHYNKIFKS